MTCKDCIHHDLCFGNGTLFLRYAKGIDKENAETKCPFENFKNKADFVEVVRCKKCIHGEDYNGRILCNKNQHIFNKTDFCSYGKRK